MNSTNREQVTEVLKKHWKSIDEFDRKWAETGDLNYYNQLILLKKQCKEILEKYYDSEKSVL